jgi:DNA-binding transcriptional LysR family regulator
VAGYWSDGAGSRLVAPFQLSVPKGRAWYLVYRPFRETDPGLAAFRGWLRQNFTEKPQS